ncbi:type III-D CRISPR-associated protein Csx19 [Desulfosoma sp.]
MSALQGCRIEPLDPAHCRAVFGWVTGGEKPDGFDEGFLWLLAHCRDGVTWGRFDRAKGAWRLSSSPFPDHCPGISQTNLLEIRLFGPRQEIFIWRCDEEFCGRLLIDDVKEETNSPARPDEETRILLGDRLEDGPKDGFTVVGTADGRQQVVPLECSPEDFHRKRSPLRLTVRHYFDQDEETGAVRIAASRLVHVFKED